MKALMPNTRLEAFCDGVFAIALTLLVIDIKIPETEEINSTTALWAELRHITPSVFAFLLSFGVIFITWVNHHNHLKLIHGSCGSFLYANGFILLTVVFIPFPTSLLGEYLFTNHAVPAVVLYDGVLALQAIGWILISFTAYKNKLGVSEKASQNIRKNGKDGIVAFVLYLGCSILAFWYPVTIAVFTTLTWIFWLIWGIHIKYEEIVVEN
jgi:uncharacterized membrane protein